MKDSSIEANYANFYSRNKYLKVYPTEFVVRILKSKYPSLNYKVPSAGDSILEIGFGDGRNTVLLCDLSLEVCGIEISAEIAGIARERMQKLGYTPELKIGRNSGIPYGSNRFDYILACHSCYYCDEGETIIDNIKEYARVLKPGGFMIASVPDAQSYIFDKSCRHADGTSRIVSDPYNNRVGYRLHGFETKSEIEELFSPLFTDFSFGYAHNNYFGIDEKVFWVVCKKQ